MKEDTYRTIIGAKSTVSIYRALEGIFEQLNIEVDWTGIEAKADSTVRMVSGRMVAMTECVELPFENNDEVNSLFCVSNNYDEAVRFILHGCMETVIEIINKLMACGAPKCFVGQTAYKDGKLVFIYGYC